MRACPSIGYYPHSTRARYVGLCIGAERIWRQKVEKAGKMAQTVASLTRKSGERPPPPAGGTSQTTSVRKLLVLLIRQRTLSHHGDNAHEVFLFVLNA